jgi:hypothetical protein
VPNSFSEGDIVSAEEMNANFQHLEQQFQGTQQALAKTVNCAAGEKIGDAINNGYTNITVSGTCTENLLFFEEWGDNTFALAPRYLKLTGADSTAKIVDATGGSENTIFVGSGTTLSMENITISGGTYGVAAYRNSNLLLSGVTIEGFTQRGISIGDSSYLGVNDGGVTITGGTGSEFGIYFTNGSSGWVHTSNISNVERAINLYAQSFTYLYNFNFNASKRGINLGDHSTVVRYQDGAGVIEGTSEYAINASQGNFYSWGSGSLTIQKLNGGRGIHMEGGASGFIANLKMPDFDNTGSGGNAAISVGYNSALSLEDAEISGSTDGALINVGNSSGIELRGLTLSGSSADSALIGMDRNSNAVIENSTITVTSAQKGIDAWASCRLDIQNSTISGTVSNALVGVARGSSAKIDGSTLTLESGKKLMKFAHNSNGDIGASQLSGTATDQLVGISKGSTVTVGDGSTLSQTGADSSDVYLEHLSFLSVWGDGGTSIGKVGCGFKGFVSADEGTVADLGTNCTE